MADTFEEACTSAKHVSIRDYCTVYVNAVVRLVNQVPTITKFVVSDWYAEDSTIARFTNGERRDF